MLCLLCIERPETRCCVQGSVKVTFVSCGPWGAFGGLGGITLSSCNVVLMTWTFYLFNLLAGVNLYLF